MPAGRFYGGSTSSTSSSDRFLGGVGGGAGIDMREQFRQILEGDGSLLQQQGHYVVYRRFDLDNRSDYWTNDEYKESVGGPSWEYQDEVHLCRYQQITSGGLVRFFEQETEGGIIHVNYRIYYLKHSIAPKREDFIYEINWEDHSSPPVIGQLVLPDEDKYNINDIYPLRGDKGRIEFYACLCRREPVKT